MVKFVAAITAIAGLLLIASAFYVFFSALRTYGRGITGDEAALIIGIPGGMIVLGLILAVGGLLLEEIVAIRLASERSARRLDEIKSALDRRS